MIATVHLPSAAGTRRLLSVLLDREVTRAEGEPVVPGVDGRSRVGLYLDDRNQPVAAAIADLGFCVHVPAALSLVPAAQARKLVEQGSITPALDEALEEVLNVLAAAFNVGHALHVRLGPVYDLPQQLPAAARTAIGTPGLRVDHLLGVPGYGEGSLSVVALPLA